MTIPEIANRRGYQEIGKDTKIMNIFGYPEPGGQVRKEIVDYDDVALSRTWAGRCDPGIVCH